MSSEKSNTSSHRTYSDRSRTGKLTSKTKSRKNGTSVISTATEDAIIQAATRKAELQCRAEALKQKLALENEEFLLQEEIRNREYAMRIRAKELSFSSSCASSIDLRSGHDEDNVEKVEQWLRAKGTESQAEPTAAAVSTGNDNLMPARHELDKETSSMRPDIPVLVTEPVAVAVNVNKGSTPSPAHAQHPTDNLTLNKGSTPSPAHDQHPTLNLTLNKGSTPSPAHDQQPTDNLTLNKGSTLSPAHDQQPTDNLTLTAILKNIIEGQREATLPLPQVDAFDGTDVIKYPTFIKNFGILVKGTGRPERKLDLLMRFTKGEAHELIKDCILLETPEKAYDKAVDLLKAEYGHPAILAAKYKEKAEKWPRIISGDKDGMRKFSIFLRNCAHAKHSNYDMTHMDNYEFLRILAGKLPVALQQQWINQVGKYRDNEQRSPNFEDLEKFVARLSRNENDPRITGLGYQSRTMKTKVDSDKGAAKKNAFATFTTPTKKIAAHVGNQKSEDQCMFCHDRSHTLDTCKKIQATKTSKEIIEFLKSQSLCFGCLKKGSHRRLGCRKLFIKDKQFCKPKRCKSTNVTSAGGRCETGAGTPDIVPCIVQSRRTGKCIKTYAFLDNGSNAVFCTDKLRCQLGLKGKGVTLPVQTLLDEQMVDGRLLDDLEVSDLCKENKIELPGVYVWGDQMPVSKEDIITDQDIKEYQYLKDVKLPTLHVEDEAEVGLLIGNNVPKATEPWDVVHSENGGPYAYKTRLGWVVSGLNRQNTCKAVSANRIIVGDDIERSLVEMYNHDYNETLAQEETEWSEEDKTFMDLMANKITKVNGHYQMPLPLRDENIKLPHNHLMAEHRMAHLKRRFSKDPVFRKEYTEVMQETINKGYAEEAPKINTDIDGRMWYLPHHGVYHPTKKKLRVVFDCAASFQGFSLNKNLLQGPDLMNSLVGVVLRFRQEHIAIMADIQAMFNQVKVPTKDRDLLRFLWWPEGDLGKPLEEFRMTTHLFGATSSPACANYALRCVAEEADEAVKDTVQKNFYVDDCLKSTSSEEQAIQLIQNLMEVLKQGGFNLTKWVSNSQAVMQTIPSSHRVKTTSSLDLGESTPNQKALGMMWLVESDELGFKIEIRDRPPTRRGILSVVSAIYDPLGFVSPVILPAKRILQSLCELQVSWDEPIPDLQRKQWDRWLNSIPQISAFTVPRCFVPVEFGKPTSVQLHHFSDASEIGYGMVSYLRFTNQRDDVHCALVLSKSRVAPLKQVTIPRLELTAAR
ncbi:uncharacterized protein [Amphiura filiformis]|uniref:uncharacterized protein n=1 Tax=Amphiura filiformis TaxID=82378 RepID=UPI003B21D609